MNVCAAHNQVCFTEVCARFPSQTIQTPLISYKLINCYYPRKKFDKVSEKWVILSIFGMNKSNVLSLMKSLIEKYHVNSHSYLVKPIKLRRRFSIGQQQKQCAEREITHHDIHGQFYCCVL